jgi:peptidoglycan hydrolase-like protein with peptidoglycan-binding domain
MSMKLLTLALTFTLAGVTGAVAAQPQDRSAGQLMNPETIHEVQAVLKEQGYDIGPVDGRWGRLTRIAVENFQLSNGMPATGQLDDRTLSALGVREHRFADAAGSSSTGVSQPPGPGWNPASQR